MLYKLRRHRNESNEVGMKLKFTRNANSVGNDIVIKFTRSTGIRSSSSSGHEIRVIVFSPFYSVAFVFVYRGDTNTKARRFRERRRRKDAYFPSSFPPQKGIKTAICGVDF